MKKELLLFSISLAIVAVGLQFLEYSYLTQAIGNEIYITTLGLTFLFIGFWMATKYFVGGKISPEETINFDLSTTVNLSEREAEVLLGIYKGLTNQEIANELFISESTVKTHVGNLYSKLSVKRRTQAIQKARSLKLLK